MRRLAMISVALIGVVFAPVTASPLLAHAGTTALIMGGSGLGDPTIYPNYVPNVAKYYLGPNSTCRQPDCDLVVVVTPGGVLPPIIGDLTYDLSVAEGVSDLSTALQKQLADHPDDQVVIFGYSQSADIVSRTLRNFAADPASAPPADQVSFVEIGNPTRPNGGIMARFPGWHIPILDLTSSGAAPTDSGYQSTDIAFLYDPIADFPRYPLNLLADLNSIFAFYTAHSAYPNPYLPNSDTLPIFAFALPDGYTAEELQQLMADPANRQTYGDTTYITIAPKNLPILEPFFDLGKFTGTSALINPVLHLIQPTLKVLIELGYDRTVPYGEPTPAELFPKIDPGKLIGDLGAAVQQGVHDAIADVTAGPTESAAPAVKTTPVVRPLPVGTRSATVRTGDRTSAAVAKAAPKSAAAAAPSGSGASSSKADKPRTSHSGSASRRAAAS